MNKFEYFKYCFNRRTYQDKMWLIAAYSVISNTPNNEKLLANCPFVIHRTDTGFYFLDENNQQVEVTGGDINNPLFRPAEIIDWKVGDHPFITEDVSTTIGGSLLNFSLLWEPFKGKAPFRNAKFDGKVIKKIIDKLMVDNPKPGEEVPPGKASVTECLKLSTQDNFLRGLNDIFVKTAGVKALTVSPEVLALRDKLFTENSDKMNDPVVFANIVDQVVEADRQEMLQGESRNFFINDGFISSARKKMFITFGLEEDPNTGEMVFVKNSLNEGWNTEQMTFYVNSAIMASYGRGIATGEGGDLVNQLINLTSLILVTEDDCGSVYGENILITEKNFSGWNGSFYLNKENKPVQITDESKNLVGTTVRMRVPQFCQTTNSCLCLKCCGVALGGNSDQLSSTVVYIGTDFMLLEMKKMHVNITQAVTLDLDDVLV